MTRTIKISDSIHYRLRVRSVKDRVKLQDLVEELLLAGLESRKSRSTLNGKGKVVARHLRDAYGRAQGLAASDFDHGKNTKVYVRRNSSFILTDLRRTDEVLGLGIEWPKRRA